MAFGQPAYLAEELYAASQGRVNLFSHPYYRVAGDFGLYCSMPGNKGIYAFSDPCGCTRRDLMQSLARHFDNPHWQWCAEQCDVQQPYAYGISPQAKPPVALPPCKHFRGIDVAILRTGWSSEDVAAGFKCGPRRIQCHQHLDANSLVIYDGPNALLEDVTDCSPEDCASLYAQLGLPADRAAADALFGRRCTIAHSTMIVDGGGQLQGKDEWGQMTPTYRTRVAGPMIQGEVFPLDCSARIIAFNQSESLSYVIGEAADAYAFPIRSFRRAVVIGSH
jgi:hypothetical protein